jgi:hypothetical protein
MQGGARYQNRVAAWFAVQMLAEADLPWDLPEGTTAESINCETTDIVDDIFAGTSDRGRIYVQAKKRLQWKELRSALNQCIGQYLKMVAKSVPLDRARDRLLLVGGPNSPEPVRIHLPNLLERLRAPLVAIPRARDAALNATERKLLANLKKAMESIWRAQTRVRLTESEFRKICPLLYVQILDVDGGGDQTRDARKDLRRDVVLEKTQSSRAWNEIVDVFVDLAVVRSGIDRDALRQKLESKRITLHGRPSYRADVAALVDLTLRTTQRLAKYSEILCATRQIRIERACLPPLQREAREGNVLVVGEPGSGKSGALHAFITKLRGQGADFVLIAADDISAASLGALRSELALEHDMVDVLKAWSGGEPAYLIIDALDAAQTSPARGLLQRLIEEVTALRGRWRVVVTIRKWDLRHNFDLQNLFRGSPAEPAYCDSEFATLRHLNVPLLDDQELEQVRSASSVLGLLIDGRTGPLDKLLRLPFNLRLLAELVDSGLTVAQLTPIRTQIELLERYWQARVLIPDRATGAVETLLRNMVRQMAQSRSREYSRRHITDLAAGPILIQLFKENVLVEFVSSSPVRGNSSALAFSHNLIHDYATARLLLRGTSAELCGELEADPDVVLSIWVGLEMHFQYLWWHNRPAFWETVFVLEASSKAPLLGKLAGPAVAADAIEVEADFEPLLERLGDADADARRAAELAFAHLVGRVSTRAPGLPDSLVGANSPPWSRLLAEVSKR